MHIVKNTSARFMVIVSSLYMNQHKKWWCLGTVPSAFGVGGGNVNLYIWHSKD